MKYKDYYISPKVKDVNLFPGHQILQNSKYGRPGYAGNYDSRNDITYGEDF